jgi:hypothetical protein
MGPPLTAGDRRPPTPVPLFHSNNSGIYRIAPFTELAIEITGLSGPCPVQSLPCRDKFCHDIIAGHTYDVGTPNGGQHFMVGPTQMLPVQVLLIADFLSKH